MKVRVLSIDYVEAIPRDLTEGVLYVSRRFGTASHLCCCGCGTKIVTPLRPTEFELVDEGGAVSLYPSVGNWNHPCQSHYWIRRNVVIEAGRMTPAGIQRARDHDDALKRAYFSETRESWVSRAITWIGRTLSRLLGRR